MPLYPFSSTANILVDDHLNCRLADFGLAATLGETQIMNNTSSSATKGSMRRMAPEMYLSMGPQTYSNGVNADKSPRDVYAFACTIFEIMTGRQDRSDQRMDGVLTIYGIWSSCVVGDDPQQRPRTVQIDGYLRQPMECREAGDAAGSSAFFAMPQQNSDEGRRKGEFRGRGAFYHIYLGVGTALPLRDAFNMQSDELRYLIPLPVMSSFYSCTPSHTRSDVNRDWDIIAVAVIPSISAHAYSKFVGRAMQSAQIGHWALEYGTLQRATDGQPDTTPRNFFRHTGNLWPGVIMAVMARLLRNIAPILVIAGISSGDNKCSTSMFRAQAVFDASQCNCNCTVIDSSPTTVPEAPRVLSCVPMTLAGLKARPA
uniref:Protein kinase domain-containing protein n=1 Tax=Moniliophthora roreri TaxID=221103 RepID=A0A0W0FFG5_MONRR